jgi:hypothetical protein
MANGRFRPTADSETGFYAEQITRNILAGAIGEIHKNDNRQIQDQAEQRHAKKYYVSPREWLMLKFPNSQNSQSDRRAGNTGKDREH